MYAHCNLKVLNGRTITWVNWQSVPQVIPVGTLLELSGQPGNWRLRDPATRRVYDLDAGAYGEEYLSKWVVPEPPKARYSPTALDSIGKQIAVVGMTREEVYVSMGPPTNANGSNTDRMTREQIMKTTSWVWRRRRFGKNIGVTFDATTGLVTRTEGIWKQ